jgi:hypothetical protein
MSRARIYSLLALAVVVNPINLAPNSVETNVVESLEARAVDHCYGVIGDQEEFLPAHKYVLLLCKVLDVRLPLPYLFLKRAERSELIPMGEVDLVGRPPGRILCDETIFRADHLALKVRRQRRVVLGKSWKRNTWLDSVHSRQGNPFTRRDGMNEP